PKPPTASAPEPPLPDPAPLAPPVPAGEVEFPRPAPPPAPHADSPEEDTLPYRRRHMEDENQENDYDREPVPAGRSLAGTIRAWFPVTIVAIFMALVAAQTAVEFLYWKESDSVPGVAFNQLRDPDYWQYLNTLEQLYMKLQP